MCRSLVRFLFSMALAMGLTASEAWADAVDVTLYYTRFSAHTVNSLRYQYDGVSTVTLGAPGLIDTLPGADGIIFAPNGNLLVGGQGDAVYQVNIAGHSHTGVTAGGTDVYHLALDPSGTTAWGGGIPGNGLASIPLSPFANGTHHSVTGAVTSVDSLAFVPATVVPGGRVYYTNSGAGGGGTVGTINMTTFVTTNLLSQAASHGMVYDSFTQCLLICGANQIAQLNPVTNAVTVRNFTVGGEFDQMTTDGNGHAWVANNDGHLLFIDFHSSLDFTNASDFTDYRSLGIGDLDDLAPLSGLGSPMVPAPAGVVLLGLGGLGLAGWQIKRRRLVLAAKTA